MGALDMRCEHRTVQQRVCKNGVSYHPRMTEQTELHAQLERSTTEFNAEHCDYATANAVIALDMRIASK